MQGQEGEPAHTEKKAGSVGESAKKKKKEGEKRKETDIHVVPTWRVRLSTREKVVITCSTIPQKKKKERE